PRRRAALLLDPPGRRPLAGLPGRGRGRPRGLRGHVARRRRPGPPLGHRGTAPPARHGLAAAGRARRHRPPRPPDRPVARIVPRVSARPPPPPPAAPVPRRARRGRGSRGGRAVSELFEPLLRPYDERRRAELVAAYMAV